MLSTLSGRLTAPWNVDGGHLQRYVNRQDYIKMTLCEELILHDKIIIPTPDFLTACGLALIIGERSLITLLEQDKLKFVRLRGNYGFVRGTESAGMLLTFLDPDGKRPQDCDIASSVEAGLNVISARLGEKRKLSMLLIRNTLHFEMTHAIDSIRQDTYRDLRETSLWKDEFVATNADWLNVPNIEPMQVVVSNPTPKPSENVLDALLLLARCNIELYLSRRLECSTVSTGSPIGDLIDLKASRLLGNDYTSESLWALLEVNGIPDFGKLDFTKTAAFEDFLKLCTGPKAADFRHWFHQIKCFDEREVLREYIALLREVPAFQSLPARILRFIVTTGLGLLPLPALGTAVSVLDAFVVDYMFKQPSPKFFIDDLREFSGVIKAG